MPTLLDDTNYDIWLEHPASGSAVKVGYKLAYNEGSPMINESLAPFVAPQIYQGTYTYESTAANVNVPLAIEDWSGGCGFEYIPGSLPISKIVYDYSTGIDASWKNKLMPQPQHQTGATTTQNPIKFLYSTLGTFAITSRYIFEWSSSTWTSRLDVGASLTITDVIEYKNSDGTYLVAGTTDQYYHSTDGITWTTFAAGSAPAYRASASATITSGSSLTVTKPTGTVDNDIMIGTVIADNAATITPPAGWTQVASEQSTDGRARVYWRRASSEGANHTWTVSTTTTTTFNISAGDQDGWVTSGSASTGDVYMNVGNITGTKYQAVMRFDTSSIPDAATVSSGYLTITPLDTNVLGIDVGYYDHGGTITNADFSATPSDTTATTFQSSGSANTPQNFTLVNLSSVNKTGNTGFRFNFPSTGAFYTQIGAFDNSTAAYRPTLTLTYTADSIATASVSSYSGAVTTGTPYDFVDSDYVADTSQTTITSGTGTSLGSNRTVVVTFAASGDDTSVRTWTANSGTERVDTGGSSYYPTISTYDFTTGAGSVATVTGTTSSAYDSLALGCMICLTPASSGYTAINIYRMAVRGSSSGEPVLWAVSSTGDVRNTTDPTDASSWSAADAIQMGQPATITGFEVLDNVFYLFTNKGITSYNGTTVATVWNNTTLSSASDDARPYTWVDQKIYFTFNGVLYRYDGTDIEKVWPRSYQGQNATRTGVITAITGDTRNLWFTIKKSDSTYVIMKCDPYTEYTVGDETFTPAFDMSVPDSSATNALIVLPGASDTLHSTNPHLLFGFGTNANYIILPRDGKTPDVDSNCRFITTSCNIQGARYDMGAKMFPKFLNSMSTYIDDESTTYSSGLAPTLYLTSGSTAAPSHTGALGFTTTNVTTDYEFTQIKPYASMRAGSNTDVVVMSGYIFNTSLNPARKRQWDITVEIDEDLELRGGGDSRYGARYLTDHLFNALTERVVYYDRLGTSYITRVLDVQSVSLGRDKSIYKITLVQLV